MNEINLLCDQALLQKIKHLVQEERSVTTQVLHHLREIERRRLFVVLGYPSLFEYAVRELGYSESSAQRRIVSMRLLKDLPELEEKIETGKLSLSVISQAQIFFRQEAKQDKPLALKEKRALLEVLEGKSTRETEKELLTRSSNPVQLKPEVIKPLNESHSEVKFVASAELLKNLEKIKGLIAHSHPDLNLSELIELLAKMALKSLDPSREPKKAVSATSTVGKHDNSLPPQKPTKALGGEKRKPISAAIRREVWRRYNNQCAFCKSIHRLQVDHVIPVGKRGESTLENLRLLCFHCNQLQADRVYGRDHMEKFRANIHANQLSSAYVSGRYLKRS